MVLRRLVLVRHGETDGESSIRFHGSTDVGLSEEGRAQMRRVAARIGHTPVDLWVASNLKRSWRSAAIASGGARVRLEADFREIHFGRWEGMTREEIQAADPVLYEAWQSGVEEFEYPHGEARADFRARVARGLERLAVLPIRNAVLVVHKGVIREVVRQLVGEAPGRDEPALGESIILTRAPDGSWFRGQHGSNPPGLSEAA